MTGVSTCLRSDSGDKGCKLRSLVNRHARGKTGLTFCFFSWSIVLLISGGGIRLLCTTVCRPTGQSHRLSRRHCHRRVRIYPVLLSQVVIVGEIGSLANLSFLFFFVINFCQCLGLHLSSMTVSVFIATLVYERFEKLNLKVEVRTGQYTLILLMKWKRGFIHYRHKINSFS